MKTIFCLCLFTLAQNISAQNYTAPDEQMNAKNGVKFVSIYSENEKQPHKIVTKNQYDKRGRLIQANGDGTTPVVRYYYDESNRYSSVQTSSPEGKFVQKATYRYDNSKGTMLLSRYANTKDSTQITSTILEDSLHRILRQTYYMEGRENSYVEFTYGAKGQVIGQKDSSAQTLTVNISLNNELTIRKVYSTKSILLHTYHFYYSEPNTIKAITDSVSGKPDTYLIQRQENYGPVNAVMKNGNKLSGQEQEQFLNLFPMVERGNMIAESEGDADDYVKKDHTIEKDEKNNITKDTLTISQGSYRQVLVFVYEYEYF